MKRPLALAIALSLFMFSCHKNDHVSPQTQEQQNAEKVPVKFSVAGFNQQVTDMNGRKVAGTGADLLRDSILEGKINRLYYLAYSTDNYHLRSFKYQDATVNNYDFGSIADTLTPGNYLIVMVGSNGPSNFSDLWSSDFGDARLTLFPGVNGPARLPDTYYKKFSIMVDKADSLPYTNISLDRISSNLEVNILDAPNRGAAYDSIEVTMSSEASFYSFAFDMSARNPNETVTRFITRKSVNTFSDYVLNADEPFSVTIKYTDKLSGAFFTKKIDNVRCYRNKKTILTGNIFDGNQGGSADGFKVSVNDTWEADAPVINF